MTKIKATQDRQYINLVREDRPNETLRYDFAKKIMEKQYQKDGKWFEVTQQYRFFSGVSLDDIDFGDDIKKKKLFELAKNKLCNFYSSISTFITKLDLFENYEGYVSQGIDVDFHFYTHWHGDIRISGVTCRYGDWPKHVMNFVKKYDITLTKSMQEKIIGDEQSAFFENLCNAIDDNDYLQDIEKSDFFITLFRYRSICDNLKSLVKDYNYNVKSLIGYLCGYLNPYENVAYDDGLELLVDYNRMAAAIGRHTKKYPKYLKSMHDIIEGNFNAFKKEYDEVAFKNIIETKRHLEFEKDGFLMMLPEVPNDIIQEGTEMNHCVGSYVDRIIDGKTFILFLRKKKEKDRSLVTVEVRAGEITQAKRACNQEILEEERKFIESFAKKKELEITFA
jgi:hypothetical protein